MNYSTTFFPSRKTILEKIESELRPLEAIFQTMLRQTSLKPETRQKIIRNLNAFSEFRKNVAHGENYNLRSSICSTPINNRILHGVFKNRSREKL